MSGPALGPGELALLEAGVAENPGSRLFLRLAEAYAGLERWDEAAAVLERGLSLRPQEVEARRLLAQVYLAQGRRPQALEQLWQAAQELGRQAGIYDMLADLWAQEGQEAAAQAARRLGKDLLDLAQGPAPAAPAAAKAPQDTVTMAEIYASQGHADKAAQIYRRLLAQEPGRADYAQRLAQLTGQSLGPAASPAPSSGLLAGLEALEAAALARSSGAQTQATAALGPLNALLGAALARTGAARA